MPQDNRRFNGPDDSVSYLKYTKDYVKPYAKLHEEIIDDKQLRKDGRALDEGRSMCMFCMYQTLGVPLAWPFAMIINLTLILQFR